MCFRAVFGLLKASCFGKEDRAARVQEPMQSWDGRSLLSWFFDVGDNGGCSNEPTGTELAKLEEGDANSFGRKRTYWLHRRAALFSSLLRELKETGGPEIIEAVNEAEDCLRQTKLEPVRRDPQQVQALMVRFRALCSHLTRVAMEDVPRGRALLEDMAECGEILMIPRTSAERYQTPYRRPEHELDLSSLPPPPNQGRDEPTAGLSAGLGCHQGESEELETCLSSPQAARISTEFRNRSHMVDVSQQREW
ncbi:g10970 [Coccomyxa viridis]|uniref:G10970 protein n=1 Tax=Coccomyxa viridis TaxID=1274662 RepID=A0ABP1GDS4_9CHLO